VLVLAIDTATTRMTAGVVELDADGVPHERSSRAGEGARTHAEHLAPWIRDVADEAGVALAGLDALVCGVGPGPFTGLRVGMVTAAALADALGRPLHGVCTHDALARPASDAGATGVLAVTDARRREVYWTITLDGVRRAGPAVSRPADLAAELSGGALSGERVDTLVGDAADALAALTGLRTAAPSGPTPAALVAVAAPDLLAGRPSGPWRPLYLRRPDAVPPGAPKPVSRPA